MWLRFRGGKGVATALGILIAASWEAGLLACLTWLAAAAFHYSSLTALAVAPVCMWHLADLQRTEFAAFLAVLVFVRPHANVRRLLKARNRPSGSNRRRGGLHATEALLGEGLSPRNPARPDVRGPHAPGRISNESLGRTPRGYGEDQKHHRERNNEFLSPKNS